MRHNSVWQCDYKEGNVLTLPQSHMHTSESWYARWHRSRRSRCQQAWPQRRPSARTRFQWCCVQRCSSVRAGPPLWPVSQNRPQRSGCLGSPEKKGVRQAGAGVSFPSPPQERWGHTSTQRQEAVESHLSPSMPCAKCLLSTELRSLGETIDMTHIHKILVSLQFNTAIFYIQGICNFSKVLNKSHSHTFGHALRPLWIIYLVLGLLTTEGDAYCLLQPLLRGGGHIEGDTQHSAHRGAHPKTGGCCHITLPG